MLKVLIIDDSVDVAQSIQRRLELEGVQADLITEQKWGAAADQACHILRTIHRQEDAYFALILDIRFVDHFIGGIMVYCQLLQERLRGRFRHLIVPTMYHPGGGPKSDPFRVVEAFQHMAFIPPENVICKGMNTDYLDLVSRLEYLKDEKLTPIGTFDMWSFK